MFFDNEQQIKEVKLLDPSRFLIQDKYKPKHKRIITGLDITDKISYNKDVTNQHLSKVGEVSKDAI